ncbi:MAG TPA: hypothetical protein DD649_10305 [Providencia sp.]|uniref:YqcC family protein n=1 Tax=Providencia sp. TaxID=589 RepID=UPI000E89DE84|nr:YqcC family protein [Providencia sp.]MBP6080033.1 YqcC family protein [Providencia sp.]HBO23262.1 hypothetical protein [Providencia sp.]
MNIEQHIVEKLRHVEDEMKAKSFWRELPPNAEAFESTEPFSIDTMEALEWLQWILIPRLYELIEKGAALPSNFSIAPYFEEVYKDDCNGDFIALFEHLRGLDNLFQFTPMGKL